MKNPFKKVFTAVLTVTMFIYTVLPVISFGEEEKLPDVSLTQSQKILLVNIDTNMVLYEREADGAFYCGFLPNVMTSILLLELGTDLTQTVMITEDVIKETHQISSARLKEGDVISLKDLISAALVSNSQEACIAIAHYVCSDTDKFIDLMNKRAAELGAKNTTFGSVNGFFSSFSRPTTMRDVCTILQYALSLEGFSELAGAPVAKITVNGQTRTLYSYNSTVVPSSKYFIKNTAGLGVYSSTDGGSSCATMMKTKNMRVLAIAANQDSLSTVYEDLKLMVDYASQTYKNVTLISAGSTVKELEVKMGEGTDFVVLTVTDDIKALLPKDFDISKISKVIELPEYVQAPVQKGAVLGTIILRYDGQVYGTSNLVAKTDVELDMMEYYTSKLNNFFKSPIFFITAGIVILAIIIYTVFGVRKSRKKNKNKKSKNHERVKMDID